MAKSGMSQQFKNMARFKQIMSVFFKHGFDYYIQYLNLEGKVPLYKKFIPPDNMANETRPVRLREAFEELGGSFIKFAQLLSLRPDWIPPQYCEEFAKLQDSVSPFSSEEAIKMVERELGAPIKKVFRSFNKVPIAAGSIAQVHKAVLKNGDTVAVKVKRPNVDELFETDIDILMHVAKIMKKKFGDQIADPIEIVNEFQKYTEAELDFKVEAKNMELFFEGFRHVRSVRVPHLYEQFSTENIITMEFLKGTKLSDYAKVRTRLASRKAVLTHIVSATFHQLFTMGHFHADPHPGNIIVMENNVVGFLDFGLVGHLTDSMKERMILMFVSLIEADLDGLVDSLIDVGAASTEIDREQFKQDLVVKLGQFYDISLKDINMSKLANAITSIVRDYKITMPSNVVMLLKTVVVVESIGEQLYPKFNLVSFAKPSIKRILNKEFSLTGMRSGFVKKARRLKRTMMVLPEQTYKFLTKLNRGDFKVEFQHRDLENLIFEMEKTSNKLVYGILCAASIIGASLAMSFPTPLQILGLPFFSFIGFFFSVVFGGLLMYEIFRRSMFT